MATGIFSNEHYNQGYNDCYQAPQWVVWSLEAFGPFFSEAEAKQFCAEHCPLTGKVKPMLKKEVVHTWPSGR